jgi:phosphoglycerate dehydrogenase-like enzyme
MPDSLTPPLVLAHQLPERLVPLLASLSGVTLQALPPERAWEVPEEAEILFAVPPRGGTVVVPPPKTPRRPGRQRWLHTVSTGVDEFPPWAFEVPIVTCGRGSNSAAIAEFTLASLLAVEKQLPQSWIRQAADWTPRPGLGTLRGKVLGLLGFGSIGQAIANLALPFGVEVLAHRRGEGDAPPGVSFTTLDNVLARADHLVIALPLTAATAGLIGRAALGRTKRGVHLVNIARGRILDHEALLAALESGQVGFASLDVTEPEPLPPGHALYTHPHAHLSPHISWGGSDPAAQINLLQENLRRFITNETLLNIVPPGRGY